MDCQAKIQDGLGGNYKCLETATKKITIETFAPHLQRIVKKSRCLCDLHAARLKSRHNYRIKHMGKKTTIIEEPSNISQ
jgi:hypothetical protein